MTGRTFPQRHYQLEQDGLPFAFYLEPHPPADTLIVTLLNVINRSYGWVPSFELLCWSQRRDFHLLSICDPTLLIDDRIEVTHFLGTTELDPMPGVCRIASAVADRLGVRRIIFWGSSGGGFAAAGAAATCGADAVAINAQISIEPLRHWPIINEVARVFGTTVKALCVHPRSSIEVKIASGAASHILWAQNRVDRHHFRRHYARLCDVYGIPLSGGISADGRATALPL